AAQSAVVSAGAEPVGSGESGAGDADLLDAICSLVEAAPSNEGLPASVRELCRERRRDLSHRGQAALPASPRGLAAGRGSARIRPGAAGPAVSVRDLARQRRAELGKNGRGTPSDYRPSGRVRPPAPAKVALGTTLSGSAVTGTLVERNPKVTGNEPGTCRVITGTEYIGAEQFDQFCGTRPLPPVPKVGVSATSQGQRMTGTEVGRSPRVTGDESGACRSVTGTEYLGSEALADFCPSSPGNTMLPARPAKVAVGATERKGLVVTGTDEARSGAVTGADAGARRAVTGSQYADAGLARLTINGPPSKVALTHTLAGRPVSGTEVGRSVKVTGDEAGACRPVSGTEYLSNEQFQTICRTRPEPPPPKVGEDSSRAGQRITGNLVDRSPKVTGNEPGACERVTGSQYGQTSLCDGAPVKVS
ncbi:carboxysome shell protein, partial [bacterium]|nr:carboxysome shell protein [bacterium]